MFTVYALQSINHNYIYVGQTSNLVNRLKRHFNGYEPTTKKYRPFYLLYSEECFDRKSAREKEKYWKSGTGKRKLKRMAELVDLPAYRR